LLAIDAMSAYSSPIHPDLQIRSHSCPHLNNVIIQDPLEEVPGNGSEPVTESQSNAEFNNLVMNANILPSPNTENSDIPMQIARSETGTLVSEQTNPESSLTPKILDNSSNNVEQSSVNARYTAPRVLQNSLFGAVQCARDNLMNCEVAIKISKKECYDNHVSQAGIKILEDVKREASVMRLLRDRSANVPSEFQLSGLSDKYIHALTKTDLELKEKFIIAFNNGYQSIVKFYSEEETEHLHYLITEYVPHGDLFTVLTKHHQHKVTPNIGRHWFRQICRGVRFLHGHKIAHLDLSLENVCCDADGTMKIIDFGLAMQHPESSSDYISPNVILATDTSKLSCDCEVCKHNSVTAVSKEEMSKSRLKFLCKPVCSKQHKPGKLGYMSPELYKNKNWDAYKHDIFALGVILYSMLTGRPPFTRPDDRGKQLADGSTQYIDVWFRVVYSGQWLEPTVRNQVPAQIYNSLPESALDLINRCISPQEQRPTIDEIMSHPFLNSH
jgi:serine/threonine protein kinase